jgi:hypothetical protein
MYLVWGWYWARGGGNMYMERERYWDMERITDLDMDLEKD